MEELSPGDVRVHTFRAAVRGFDRTEVERYLEHVADYLEALQQQLHQAGVTEVVAPHDLAAEYEAVGEEVATVLTEARASADSMRARAAADAASWRADAEEESSQAQADAASAVRQVRESAWETGTEMLDQVVAQCEALLVEASESSLRIRSEAEREASRMVTDAQREREELLRAGREEADRTVGAARKEADALLMGARHEADVAHERARALEERRAELMEELESAQKALLGIEDEPEGPDVEPEQDEPEVGDEAPPTRSHWPEDEGGVRIVAARPTVPEEPVDADALAAEVEALRGRRPVAPNLGGRSATAPSGSGEAAAASEPAARGGAISEPSSPQGEETPEPVEPGSEPESVEPPQSAAPPEQETPEPVAKPEKRPDPLAGLFDELRNGDVTEPSDNGSAADEPAPAPAPVAVVTEEPAEEPVAPASPPDVAIDPFALRDRLLLPVQNRALRLVKRELVSAQNRALEELRLDPEWMPEADLVDGEIGGALVDLTAESTAAGFAAAAELMGTADAPSPDLEVADPTDEFTGAFVDAVALSLERSRGSGAGKRETSSSLSRVFRAWRTDDAERRVRLLSRRAYHGGVLAALLAMSCDRVSVIPLGRSCVDHSEASPPWLIIEGPPAGTLLPPASLECSCTIVPDR